MIEIRWQGRGGQGAFTASKILGAAVAGYEGKYALAFPSFGPERRGAPIQAFTKIDDKPVTNRTEIKDCDYIVFLDETLFDRSVLKDLKEEGKVLVNSSNPTKYNQYSQVITLDATKMAREIMGAPITNTAMLGALLGISKLSKLSSVESIIQDYLSEKVIEKNKSIMEQAYQMVKEIL